LERRDQRRGKATVVSTPASSRRRAETLCLHGDTPGAPRIAAAVAACLRDAGIAINPPDR